MDGWMNEMKIIEETLEKRLMSLRSESSPGLRGSAAFRQFQGSQSSTKIGCHQGIWERIACSNHSRSLESPT